MVLMVGRLGGGGGRGVVLRGFSVFIRVVRVFDLLITVTIYVRTTPTLVFVLGMETNKIIPLGAKIGRGVDAF
jgi:hypothetical protein